MSDSNNSTQILGELQQIKGSLEHFVREDSSTKRAFDTLYQELQQYKSDFLFQFEKRISHRPAQFLRQPHMVSKCA